MPTFFATKLCITHQTICRTLCFKLLTHNVRMLWTHGVKKTRWSGLQNGGRERKKQRVKRRNRPEKTSGTVTERLNDVNCKSYEADTERILCT